MLYNIKYAPALARVKKNTYLCELFMVWTVQCKYEVLTCSET